MDVVYQKATDQIDFETGFRCRTVYVSTENSVLHCHDYYELFLTLSDSVLHLINGREEELEKGTLIFIRKSDTTESTKLPFLYAPELPLISLMDR